MGSKKIDEIPPKVVSRTRNPAQRFFHALISVLGWILFGYFWYTIFARKLDRQATTTFLLILLVLGGIIVVNLLWIQFNRNIYRRLGRRTRVREAAMTPSEDKLGRPLEGAEWPRLQGAGWVVVELDGPRKVYRAELGPCGSGLSGPISLPAGSGRSA